MQTKVNGKALEMRRLICGLALMGAATVATAGAQAPSAISIRRERAGLDDPVKIVGVYIDGQFHSLLRLEPPDRFAASADWIDSVKVVVQNVSGKAVIAGQLQINCPGLRQDQAEEPAIFDMLVRGQIPKRFWRAPNSGPVNPQAGPAEPAISVPPGGAVLFSVKDNSTGLRSRTLPDEHPVACEFGLRDFHFADGSMWRPRQFFRPDLQLDYGYIEESPQEFGMSIRNK